MVKSACPEWLEYCRVNAIAHAMGFALCVAEGAYIACPLPGRWPMFHHGKQSLRIAKFDGLGEALAWLKGFIAARTVRKWKPLAVSG